MRMIEGHAIRPQPCFRRFPGHRRTVLADTASTTQAQSGNLPLRRMAMTRSRRIVRKEGRFEDVVSVCKIDDCILHRQSTEDHDYSKHQWFHQMFKVI